MGFGLLVACGDKAEPGFNECEKLAKAGKLEEAKEACHQAARQSPTSAFGIKSIQKIDELTAKLDTIIPANVSVLGWGFYQGARDDAVYGPHLHPKLLGSGWYNLMVSSGALLDDLEGGIQLFRTLGPNQVLGPENERVTLWNRAARELTEPRAFNFPPLP